MSVVRAARVKICGVRTIADAILCVDAGADAIGLNFVRESPRRVSRDDARRIVDAVGARVLVVGVVSDMTTDAMRELRDSLGLGCLQLHGDETPETLAPLLPHAYKAIRVRDASDVARARTYAGEHILVDARVDGALGGTGATFDWSLVTNLANERKLTLAGGLTAANVEEAIRAVSPYCVDVASGVERAPREAPGVKDEALVRAFVSRAKRA